MRGGVAAIAVALAVLAGCGAPAPSVNSAGSVKVSGLWTTATPPGAPTASGYLTITNTGTVADRLTAVTSPLAAGAMLHEMEIADGVASMRMVDGIDIPPGKTVALAPNGFHIMFVTLKQPLKAGDSVPVVLTFAKAGRIEATLAVLPIGARGPAP
jgi:copper(I)-binding protein